MGKAAVNFCTLLLLCGVGFGQTLTRADKKKAATCAPNSGVDSRNAMVLAPVFTKRSRVSAMLPTARSAGNWTQAAHNQRHTKQILEVNTDPNFPKS